MGAVADVLGPLPDFGFEPTGKMFWLGSELGWVGAQVTDQGPSRAVIVAQPGGGTRIVTRVADDRICEPVPGNGVLLTPLGASGPAFVRDGLLSNQVLGDGGDGLDPVVACMNRTGTARLALAQQGFNVSGLAVSGDTIIACRLGDSGVSEIWRIDGSGRRLLGSVPWPLAQDNPVLEFQAFEEACLIYPSLLPRRRAELRAQYPGIPVLRVMPNGMTEEHWIDWGDWNAEGGYRVTHGRDGILVGILHGWTDLGERYSGLWRHAAPGWARVAAGQLDPGSLATSPDGRWCAWREQRQQPADAERRFRYLAMLLETGAA
jgi:hypothetical protein